jgi:predicted nucleic acid-binding protein
MSDKCFVDANVLAYAHDRAAGTKYQRARALIEALWNSGGGILSTQVLQELCINVRHKSRHPLTIEETRRLIQDYSSWTIVTKTAESVLEALDIEAHHKDFILGCTHCSSCRQFRCHGPLLRRSRTRTDLWFGSRCQPAELHIDCTRTICFHRSGQRREGICFSKSAGLEGDLGPRCWSRRGSRSSVVRSQTARQRTRPSGVAASNGGLSPWDGSGTVRQL